MPDNKNQHFVPKGLFKPFTANAEGRSVCVLNIATNKAIRIASVKGQCSKNDFYGQYENLEKAILAMEGYYGTLRDKIIKHELAYDNFNEQIFAKRFIYFQHMRTKAHIDRAQTAMSQMALNCGLNLGEIPTMRDQITMAMRTFRDNMKILDGLKICLIENMSNRDFIMSDNPSIITNRWHLQKHRTANFGLRNSGILAFLPITPRIAAMLYDSGIYSISRAGLWFKASKEADIQAINEHQFLHCAANIYFSRWDELEAIRRDCANTRHNRPQEQARSSLTTAVLRKEDKWSKRFEVRPQSGLPDSENFLVHLKSVNPSPSRWPSFLKYRPNPIFIDTNSGAGFLRRHTENWYA